MSLGFKQLISDQCVYSKGPGESQLIVCTWVGDIALSSARGNDAARVEFDAALRREFEMSPWTSGEASWVLNMKVVRDWHVGTLHISQPGAIEKLAAQFGLTGRERASSLGADGSATQANEAGCGKHGTSFSLRLSECSGCFGSIYH